MHKNQPEPNTTASDHPGKRVLIAPACFKGSLSAPAVAEHLISCLRQSLPPDVLLDCCPIADGGDDTLAVLQAVNPSFERHWVSVTGPVPGMRVQASYLWHADLKLAVLEAAQAHGYQLLTRPVSISPQTEESDSTALSTQKSPTVPGLAPLAATSYGVGELLKAALALQPETIVLTVGGSASTDGGMGALQALGVQFRDVHGQLIETPLGGGTLETVARIEWLENWSFSGRLLIATDVGNPLLGPEGTATVFAPQKGADAAQCSQLEANLTHISSLLTAINLPGTTGLSEMSGVGAAGGLAYGLRHLPRSGIIAGSQWLAEQLNLPARIQAADVILTGEGRLDATSFRGKATGHVLAWAAKKPVFFFCGQVDPTLAFPANVCVLPLSNAEGSRQWAMQHPEQALTQAIQTCLPEIRAALASGSVSS